MCVCVCVFIFFLSNFLVNYTVVSRIDLINCGGDILFCVAYAFSGKFTDTFYHACTYIIKTSEISSKPLGVTLAFN